MEKPGKTSERYRDSKAAMISSGKLKLRLFLVLVVFITGIPASFYGSSTFSVDLIYGGIKSTENSTR